MAVIINDYIGTTAGQPAYTPFNGGRTYSRILDGLGLSVLFARAVQSVRKNEISTFENCKNYYRELRIGDHSPGWWGVWFQTLYCDDRTDLTNHAHTLEKIGKPLEELTSIPIKDLQHQCQSYGMDYLVNRYFDGVETAEDGALVVYYDQNDKAVHSGIYHKYSGRTWRTAGGGTIESRWSHGCSGNPYVFQHEPFFLPREFGDIAKFYRMKKALPPLTVPAKHDGDPMYESRDGAFQFVRSEANGKIRSTVDATTMDKLVQIYPQIECVSDINFFGVCFMYAMDRIFQSRLDAVHEKVPVCEHDLCGSHPSKFLEEYFTPVPIPQVGDLAVYSRSFGYRTHFGVYVDDDLIESKWGSLRVYRHPPFYVGNDCGDTLIYYRLKNLSEYSNPNEISC